MECPRWLPLESNPEVMTKFVSSLGMRPTWQFGDVYGLDPELLSMVPRPVCAVLLLFPVTEKYEAFKQEEEERLKDKQQISPDIYFMKQTIGNACGTIGLIHAVANNVAHLEFGEAAFQEPIWNIALLRACRARHCSPGAVTEFCSWLIHDLLNIVESDSPLKTFLIRTSKMTPEERASFLEQDESIRVIHESSAQEGQTEAPGLDEKVNLHFIAFVNVGGQLYELDGRKPFPIIHGKTSVETFLEDAVGVCKIFMAQDPHEVRFTIITLSKVSD